MELMQRQILKKMKKFFKRHRKETKGAISLFMALVISPLLSLSLVLVESARYQDAAALMEEISDSAAFSTIAEYDSFLDERFGLFGVSQETNINEMFSNYLKENVDMMGNHVDLLSQSAHGEYALSDTHVLKQQILEVSELSVPAELASNTIDIEKLIKALQKSLDIEDFAKDIKALNAGLDVAKELEKILENTYKTIEHYNNKYKPALDAYRTTYANFEEKVDKYVEALKNFETAQQAADSAASTATSAQNASNQDSKNKDKKKEAEDAKKESDKAAQEANKKQQELTQAKNELETAIATYKNANQVLSTQLSTLKGYVDGLLTALDSIPTKLMAFENATSEGGLANDCTTSTYEWVLIIADQATKMIRKSVGGDEYIDKVNQELKLLSEQLTKLSETSSATFDSTWDTSKTYSEYGAISIITFGEIFIVNLNDLIKTLNDNTKLSPEAETSLGDLLVIAKELIGINGIYDGNLDSVVSASNMYVPTYMSVSSQLSVESLTALIASAENFISGMTSLNIIKAIKALIKFIEAVIKFLGAVLAWAGDIIINLGGHIAGGIKEIYNSLLLYGYAAYNLPNRTTIYSAKSLNGYSFKKIFDLAGGQYSVDSLQGSLAELSSFGNSYGIDKMFKGAEGEYILVGSASELQNQAVTFFDLYLFRLISDIMQVFKAPEVSALAAMTGPCALAVKILIAMAEPMLDTVILANGGKQFLFKETVYFSYAGIINLGNDLIGISSISKNVQDKLKDLIKAHNGSPSNKGFLDIKLKYNEYLLLLTMLMVDQQEYMQRLRNIIQMEAMKKHSDDFSLDKAYTYVKSDVSYELNPMFELNGFNDSEIFTVNMSRYTGY